MPTLAWESDLWFGADIPRHIWWTIDLPDSWGRGALHPGSLVTFKLYGVLLHAIDRVPSPERLAVFAVPAIVATAFALPISSYFVGAGPRQTRTVLSVLAGTVIGPALVFAPVPESHMLGAAALLMEGAFIARLARPGSAAEDRARTERFVIGLTVVCGVIAASFTLTNVVPALVLFFATPSSWLRHWRRALTVAGLCLVVGILIFVVLHRAGSVEPPWPAETLREQGQWVSPPTIGTVWESFRGLVLSQFGLPSATFGHCTRDSGEHVTRLVLQERVPLLSVVAFAFWWVGISLSLVRGCGHAAGRRFTGACLVALALQVGWHSAYATDETYLFSPNAWPLVLLPGVFVLQNTHEHRLALSTLFLWAAIILSALQTAVGFSTLFRLMDKM